MRLFEEHIKRKVKILDGAWRFLIDKNNVGKHESWFLGIKNAETVIVPSVWNTKKELFAYEGVAWYEKDFYMTGKNLRLCFEGIMTESEVWLDGKYLGNHYGGFSQFSFFALDVEEGMHRISIRVDNSFNEKSIPQSFVDWYHYGGITRSVTVESPEGIVILSNKLKYSLSEDMNDISGKISLELYNCEKETNSTNIKVEINGETVCVDSVEVEGRKTFFAELPEFKMMNIDLWDIGNPNLYNLSIYTNTDDLQDRVGFRKIETHDSKIFLNGKEIEIKGINRHEDHPECGLAFPANLMQRDLELIIEMGANSIRGSHYPNSQQFVDYLDEKGVLFWSEIPIWGGGFSDVALADETVVNRGFLMHEEMVKYYYNHPSIVMWGMHNEILVGCEAGKKMTEKYYKYLKENGGNRLVVYASNKESDDICYEFTDVLCFNCYIGWYGGNIEEWKTKIEQMVEWKKIKGIQHKPIIFGEFGAAALYGCHDDESVMWSEEYQAKLVEHCLKLFHESQEVSGCFIWQFADIRTSHRDKITRARGFNNKGIVNEYRKPKLAYYAAKRIYSNNA